MTERPDTARLYNLAVHIEGSMPQASRFLHDVARWTDAQPADAHLTAEERRPTQAETLAWVAERWPDRTTPRWRASKLCEEAGEVMGAIVKMDEGRKTAADLEQETAQVVICAMALAESAGFDLNAAVAAEFDRCTKPSAAGSTPAAPAAPAVGPQPATEVLEKLTAALQRADQHIERWDELVKVGQPDRNGYGIDAAFACVDLVEELASTMRDSPLGLAMDLGRAASEAVGLVLEEHGVEMDW